MPEPNLGIRRTATLQVPKNPLLDKSGKEKAYVFAVGTTAPSQSLGGEPPKTAPLAEAAADRKVPCPLPSTLTTVVGEHVKEVQDAGMDEASVDNSEQGATSAGGDAAEKKKAGENGGEVELSTATAAVDEKV